jgi:hypothetical protein
MVYILLHYLKNLNDIIPLNTTKQNLDHETTLLHILYIYCFFSFSFGEKLSSIIACCYRKPSLLTFTMPRRLRIKKMGKP